VPENKTVPFTYPESPITAQMPTHLDDGEGSLGTHMDVSHLAATPPGMTVKVDVEVVEVQGRKIVFKVGAHDGMDLIGEGRHARVVVAWDRFNAKVAEKVKTAAELVS
jgi:fluoroacetyl-CoA thioesterase